MLPAGERAQPTRSLIPHISLRYHQIAQAAYEIHVMSSFAVDMGLRETSERP